jgi:hypothetical protein
MSHYAKVENGIVTRVIVAEQDVIAAFPDAASWIQTSYNTRRNQHPENRPLRGNFAGVGYLYFAEHDIFVYPCAFPSWTLNTQTADWDPPVPYPTDGQRYLWDEDQLNWTLAQNP